VASANPVKNEELTVSWDLVTCCKTLTDDVLNVDDRAVTVRLSEISGRVIIEQALEGSNGSTILNVAGLTPGVFVVRVVAEDGYSVSTKPVKL